MTIVVDASILISALINPTGKEAAILFDCAEKVDFVAPDLIFTEVLSKKNIISNSHLSESSFEQSLRLIQSTLSVFSVEKYHPDLLKVAELLLIRLIKRTHNNSANYSFGRTFLDRGFKIIKRS